MLRLATGLHLVMISGSSFLISSFFIPFIGQFVADLVYLRKVSVAMVVSSMLQGRNMRIVAHKGVVTASAEVLLGYRFRDDRWNRSYFVVPLFVVLLSNLGIRYGFLSFVLTMVVLLSSLQLHLLLPKLEALLYLLELLLRGEHGGSYQTGRVKLRYVNHGFSNFLNCLRFIQVEYVIFTLLPLTDFFDRVFAIHPNCGSRWELLKNKGPVQPLLLPDQVDAARHIIPDEPVWLFHLLFEQ